MMSWGVILILAVILSGVLVTLGWCIILIIPSILGWALILSWLLDGAMWVRRKLHTAEEELDGLDQPEESGNQVNVTSYEGIEVKLRFLVPGELRFLKTGALPANLVSGGIVDPGP